MNSPTRIKGRGAVSNPVGRFESRHVAAFDDGWWRDEELPARPETRVVEEQARSMIQHNDSPDLPFDLTLNPYRGCEHGCIYCYARPNHEYLNLSAGLDFETQLYAKVNGAEVLRRELGKSGHVVSAINLGGSTDPYQPIERRYRLSRQLIEVLVQTRHPLTVVTKHALVVRDLDLLIDLARDQLVRVFISITSLDNQLASRLEPRASAPHSRLKAVSTLAAAGVPVSVLISPIIPIITDPEMEALMRAAREAGASHISYQLVRLPYQVSSLFREWLELHYPLRASHVMSVIQQMRGGRDNDPRFGSRMRGEGVFADLLKRRFSVAAKRLGLADHKALPLRCDLFQRPTQAIAASPQGDLFG